MAAFDVYRIGELAIRTLSISRDSKKAEPHGSTFLDIENPM